MKFRPPSPTPHFFPAVCCVCVHHEDDDSAVVCGVCCAITAINRIIITLSLLCSFFSSCLASWKPNNFLGQTSTLMLPPLTSTSTSSVDLQENNRPKNNLQENDYDHDMDRNIKQSTNVLSYRHILVPTVIYFALVFALYPLQIQIIIQSICDNKGSDDDGDESDDGDCDSAAISSRAAIINTYCSIALYLPAILLTGLMQ